MSFVGFVSHIQKAQITERSAAPKTGIWQTFPKSVQMTQTEQQQNVDPVPPATHAGRFYNPVSTFVFCLCSEPGRAAGMARPVTTTIVPDKGNFALH